jgi:hypothetical protein
MTWERNMGNSVYELREKTRRRFHHIWKIARAGDLDSLSGEDRKLGRIMLEHEQYHDQFEIADELCDHDYDPESEVNPFIHVTFHCVVENQLEARDPIEAFQFYNAMRQNKVSRHETIHRIAYILAPLVYGVVKGDAKFDLERYRSLLKRYKNKKPDKLMGAIEKEFDQERSWE